MTLRIQSAPDGVRPMISTNDQIYYFYRGRIALYWLLRALGIGPGDEVLIQAFTCLAVPVPILALGARPVYVDIDADTYTVKPTLLEKSISSRTRAIVVQHTYGIPAEMNALLAIASKHRLPVIEDCCHVLASTYDGRSLGTFGAAAFYSYEWGKPVVAGIGGGALISDPALRNSIDAIYKDLRNPSRGRVMITELQYLAFRMLRRPALYWLLQSLYHSLSKAGLLIGNFAAAEWNAQASPEYGLRMAPMLQARCRKARLSAITAAARRREIVARYEEGLSALNIPTLRPRPRTEAVLLRYPVLCSDKAAVLAQARRDRVEVGSWFRTPIDPLTDNELQKVIYTPGSCPVSERVSAEMITLPVYDGVRNETIEGTLRFLQRMRDLGFIQSQPVYTGVAGCL
jgi:perosamine synthetase